MDAVASEISLVERSSRCAIHIFTQTRFLEVTYSSVTRYELLRAESALASAHNQPNLLGMHNWNQHLLSKCTKLGLK